MPLEVKVGPPQIAIHHGHTVLVSEPDGCVVWPTDKGLYFRDTRLVSAWRIYADGETWEPLNGGPLTYYAARVFLTNRKLDTVAGKVEPRTLSLVINRTMRDGMHEDLDLTNHGMKPVRFNLELAIRSDFADIFEVKTSTIVRRGHIAAEWLQDTGCLNTGYSNDSFSRGIAVRAERAGSPPTYANGRISFAIDLAPGASWHTCLLYEPRDGEITYAAPPDCIAHVGHDDIEHAPLGETMRRWREATLRLSCSNEEFYRLYHQAVGDMAALRLPVEDEEEKFIPAAGLPWFLAVFGRDSLIVSLQTMLVNPEFGRGALEALGSLQARERDDHRDAEPGKIPHELRIGELAQLKLIPHTPYYGTADATPLYLITLHATWRACGDRKLVERMLPVAERALAWIDEYGDRDGDGFQEYQTRSSAGYENQAWKDAGDSVMYLDGSIVKGPKALCELQGYVHDAWLRMAEIYDALGRPADATRLRDKADTLFRRFNEAFWNEAEGFYAYALDGDKKQVLSVASNPGHCLWSGIVPPERAARVMQRLMRPDMWSGWGIRTLSAEHCAYNPYSYQNGSVWPHDNGIIALGFKRYGFHDEAGRIARDVSGAASYFAQHQLPELFAGIERDGANFPVQYLGANVPQAWAAGSVFMLLQSILGIVPDAPRGKLHLDPALPPWLPDVTLRQLRVGDMEFDLRFVREGETTHVDVLRGDTRAIERGALSWRLWE